MGNIFVSSLCFANWMSIVDLAHIPTITKPQASWGPLYMTYIICIYVCVVVCVCMYVYLDVCVNTHESCRSI